MTSLTTRRINLLGWLVVVVAGVGLGFGIGGALIGLLNRHEARHVNQPAAPRPIGFRR